MGAGDTSLGGLVSVGAHSAGSEAGVSGLIIVGGAGGTFGEGGAGLAGNVALAADSLGGSELAFWAGGFAFCSVQDAADRA